VLFEGRAPPDGNDQDARRVRTLRDELGQRRQLHPLRGDAVGARHRDEIDRLRGGEQRLELREHVLRQVREDPAAVVVDDDERRGR
jgi:hypothetical protein